MNVIDIECLDKNTQTAPYCGRYEVYKVTYQKNMVYIVELMDKSFDYGDQVIKNVPKYVLNFVEELILRGDCMSTHKVKLNMSEEFTEELKKEIKSVSPSEFFTKWKEMLKIFDETFETDTKRHEAILNQSINIELPALGIKTELPFCPPTIEALDKLYEYLIEDEYVGFLVSEEQCVCTGGGIYLAEVPFEYDDKNFVMVVSSEDSTEWAVYYNVLKDNGKYESVEYDELMELTGNANNIYPDFQIYYIRALQLLANR